MSDRFKHGGVAMNTAEKPGELIQLLEEALALSEDIGDATTR
jgi:hypothetical protein